MKMASKNRVLLITGDGKGKTTAALGMALRAAGHGFQVCVMQFIKRRGDTGEARALAGVPKVELHLCGEGFVVAKAGPVFEKHARAAESGLARVAMKLSDPAYGMVVLDEVCGAVAQGLLTPQAVRAAIDGAARGKVIVLTGRDACQELIDLADTVSRIECVKHGMADGWPAQEGVEW
jgi:cob(I)alamin adenosyltransferase